MPRTVAVDHFTSGIWVATGPLRLRTLTCVECGHRATTWAAFRAHRPGCTGRRGAGPPMPPALALALSEDDLGRLASLAAATATATATATAP